MARLVKPQLVAQLRGAGLAGMGTVETSPEQHEALEGLIKALDEEAVETLFGEQDQIQITLRKPPVSEVWVRVDERT